MHQAEILLALIAGVVVILVAAYKWRYVGYGIGGIGAILSLAIIADDMSRHDDFLDGLGTFIGLMGLVAALVVAGTAVLGQYIRRKRAGAIAI